MNRGKNIRIAMAQILVEGGEPERNMQRAEKMIIEAVKDRCDIVLLPETMDLAWTHPSCMEEAVPIPGSRSEFFCELAKQYCVWICVGLTELSDGKRYNTAILINDLGEIVLKYRKVNLLEVEFPYYEVGQQLTVVDTPFGKIGVNICADNYMDGLCLGHSLARMGAQLIISPSSWTVDHFVTEADDPYKEKWYRPLSLLATTYEIPVLSTTSVGYIVGGPYEGKKMVGRSLAVLKDGTSVQAEFNEFAGALKMVEVEMGDAKWKGVQYGQRIAQLPNGAPAR